MSSAHTLTHIPDLMARVDVTLGIYGTRVSSVDFGSRWKILSNVFRRLNDWQQIVVLQNQLAETLFDSEGNPAADHQDKINLYFDLTEINDALLSGKLDLCKVCGCMEGVHGLYERCPDQRAYLGPRVLSDRFKRS